MEIYSWQHVHGSSHDLYPINRKRTSSFADLSHPRLNCIFGSNILSWYFEYAHQVE
jgi:hypothetical protein